MFGGGGPFQIPALGSIGLLTALLVLTLTCMGSRRRDDGDGGKR